MNKIYVPLHIHSNVGSLLDGFGSIDSNIKRAKELNLPALALTDHGNLAGVLQHIEGCKKAKIKPICGVELYLCNGDPRNEINKNRYYQHMVIWAKNKQGWIDMMKLVNHTNHPNCFYYKPRITLFSTSEYVGMDRFLNGNIMGFSGHQGSYLANNLFSDALSLDIETIQKQIKMAYGRYKDAKDPEYYKRFLKSNWLESTCELATKLENIFGKDNFFIEIQNEYNPNDIQPLYIQPLIAECLREVAKQTNIWPVASCDAHYSSKEQAVDQRLVLMIKMKETEASVKKKMEEDDDSSAFFGSDEFYIHSYDEMAQRLTQEELDNTVKIADKIEIFDIKNKPILPKFIVPPDVKLDYIKYEFCKTEQDKFLVHLCITNAKKLQPWLKTQIPKEKYWERLNEEWNMIFTVGLTDYFLTIWDICKAADLRPKDHSFDWYSNHIKNGKIDPIARGVGRGSVGGCLTAYLIEIIGLDTLEYNMSLSRFFNAGRCSFGCIDYTEYSFKEFLNDIESQKKQ